MPVKYILNPIPKGYGPLPESAPVPVDQVLKVDGKFEEAFWKVLPFQPIAKAVQGTPTAKASFALLWAGDPKGLWQGAKPGQFVLGEKKGVKWTIGASGLVLAVKVLDGPKGKSAKDGVHIFIDARHDGKVIYGATTRISSSRAAFGIPWVILPSSGV